MPVEGGPNIVEDGLVFYVDAANPRSYVSGSLDTISLVPVSYTGSLINDTQFEDINQGTWAFDGAGDYIDCGTTLGDQLGDNYTGNLSVSMWFKMTGSNAGNDDGIFHIGGLDGGYGPFDIAVRSSKMDFWMGAGKAAIDFTDTGSWHNVAAVYTSGSAADCNIYLDNILRTDAIKTSLPQPTTAMDFAGEKMAIGAYWTTIYVFTGLIANVQIYNKALSEAEVLQNYNALKHRFT